MQEVEFSILYWFQGLHNPVLDKFEVAVSSLGNAGILWIVLALLMVILCKDKKGGWSAGAALVLSGIIINLLIKPLVARDRPCWIADPSTFAQLVPIPKDYSFPSGHSSAAFAFSVAIFPYYRKWSIASLVLSVLIALSRMYLFVHWPTDVLCGTLLGIAEGLLGIIIVKFICQKMEEKKQVEM